MMQIPEITDAEMAFGTIKHLPNYFSLPEDFQRHRGNAYVEAISAWFFCGAKKIENGIEVGGVKFVAKAGVDADKALNAIGAALRSFQPKHEHKEAGCAFMLSEWFDIKKD